MVGGRGETGALKIKIPVKPAVMLEARRKAPLAPTARRPHHELDVRS
jgi:hypothetical protein